MKKKLTGVALVLAAVSLMGIQPAGACTRAVYLGPDRMVVRSEEHTSELQSHA